MLDTHTGELSWGPREGGGAGCCINEALASRMIRPVLCDALKLIVLLLVVQVEVERGMSFEEAVEKLNHDTYPGEGFYTSKRVSHCVYPVCLRI